jgi:polyhydroxyalkanoate synthase
MPRILAVALLSGCAHRLEPSMTPSDVATWHTADQWSGDIRHYPGDGPPVILMHGMGANHYNFDFRPEVSLAAYLQERGWDVWVPELRGDPGSTPPSKKAWRNYTFDDHATMDVPAIVDAVRATTGDDQVYWVGHSMGGMLLYTELVQHPDAIAAGVAVSSPSSLDDVPGLYRKAAHFGWIAGHRGRMPAHLGVALSAPLGHANPMYGRLGYRDNLDWAEVRGLQHVALLDLSRPTAQQALGWVRAGAITRVDGTPWFDDVGAVDVPLLVLGGSADRIVPAANVEHTCEIFANCTYRLMGTDGGMSTEYGHVDAMVGKASEAEIYPIIAQWLADQRDRVESSD